MKTGREETYKRIIIRDPMKGRPPILPCIYKEGAD